MQVKYHSGSIIWFPAHTVNCYIFIDSLFILREPALLYSILMFNCWSLFQNVALCATFTLSSITRVGIWQYLVLQWHVLFSKMIVCLKVILGSQFDSTEQTDSCCTVRFLQLSPPVLCFSINYVFSLIKSTFLGPQSQQQLVKKRHSFRA